MKTEIISRILENVKLSEVPIGLTSDNPQFNQMVPVTCMRFIPCMGVANDGASSLNILADAQYTYVRHFNSGSRNYDAADLMQYYLGVVSLYLFIEYCFKVKGCLDLYSYNHRYLPKILADQMGFNLKDLQANQQDFVKWVNTCVDRLATLCLPTEFTMLERWSEKMSFLYLDDFVESKTPQFFHYVPECLYKLNWADAKLEPYKYIDWSINQKLKFADLQNVFETLISSFVNNEDEAIISGDILKAYKDSLYTINYLDDNYELKIVQTTNEHMAYILNMDVVEPYTYDADLMTLENWEYSQVAGLLNFNPSVGVAHFVGSTPTYNVISGDYPDMIRNYVNDLYNTYHGSQIRLSFLSQTPSDAEVAEAILSKVITNPKVQTWDFDKGILYNKAVALGSEVIVRVISQPINNQMLKIEYGTSFLINNEHAEYANRASLPNYMISAYFGGVANEWGGLLNYSTWSQFANLRKPFLSVLGTYTSSTSDVVGLISHRFYGGNITTGTPDYHYDIYDDSHTLMLDTTYNFNPVYNELMLPNDTIFYALKRYEFEALNQNLWFKR